MASPTRRRGSSNETRGCRNACPAGGYDTAASELFPIGGGKPNETCKRLSGCDPLYPIVVCPLLGPRQTANEDVVTPAWSTFIKLFQARPSSRSRRPPAVRRSVCCHGAREPSGLAGSPSANLGTIRSRSTKEDRSEQNPARPGADLAAGRDSRARQSTSPNQQKPNPASIPQEWKPAAFATLP